MKALCALLRGKRAYLALSKHSLEQGGASSCLSRTIYWMPQPSPCGWARGYRQAQSPRSSWSGLFKKVLSTRWTQVVTDDLLPQTRSAYPARFALLGRPPKKSAVTCSSCSSWICRDLTWHQNMSALLEPESSSLPGGSPGRLCPRAREKVSCLLLCIFSKADVQSVSHSCAILSACGWLYNTAYAPRDPCIYL